MFSFLAVNSVLLFGASVKMFTNVLRNVSLEYKNSNITDSGLIEAFIMRILFVMVLIAHIPFVFFSGKEALLIMVDEIDRKTISRSLNASFSLKKNLLSSNNYNILSINSEFLRGDIDNYYKSTEPG